MNHALSPLAETVDLSLCKERLYLHQILKAVTLKLVTSCFNKICYVPAKIQNW